MTPTLFSNSGFFIYSFVFTQVCVSVCVCLCEETCGGQEPTLGRCLSLLLPILYFEMGSLTEPEAHQFSRQPGQKVPATSPMLGLQSHVGDPDFMYVLKTPNQVFMLAWRALY